MRDKAAAREFKRQQLIALKAKNGQTQGAKPSVHPVNKPVEPEKPRKCGYCDGTGAHVGLFKTDMCASCNGCGFDISDPIKVIQWQAASLAKARVMYKRLSNQHSDLMNRYGEQRYKDEELLKAIRGKDLKGRLD